MNEPRIIEKEGRKVPEINGKYLNSISPDQKLVTALKFVRNCKDLKSISEDEIYGSLKLSTSEGKWIPFVWNHSLNIVHTLPMIQDRIVCKCVYLGSDSDGNVKGQVRFCEEGWYKFIWNYKTDAVELDPAEME